jgi:DNA-binding response OmpR family regulator
MGATSVLLIESARTNGVSFAAALKRKYQVRIAHTGKQALAMVQESHPDVIVLDAASLRTSGNRIVDRLRAVQGQMPIIHIQSQDRAGANSPADVLLVQPFTSRKLINRIEKFVSTSLGDRRDAGAHGLALQQPLAAPAADKQLAPRLSALMELLKQSPNVTPKLIALMELFVQNPNVTLERRQIMQSIWNTDYMGDTRTLDVHIHWIRKVLEPDPRKPQIIQTVRGVGYRLCLSEEAPAAAGAALAPTKLPAG